MPNQTPLEESAARLQRLSEIKNRGINPYPSKAKVPATHTCEQAIVLYEKLEEKTITLQGRLRSLRLHGGSCFADIEDESGRLQLYFKKDEIGKDSYKNLKDLIDVADFMSVTGNLVTTHKGEKTLMVKEWELLTKTLLPLPEKWHGLTDTEIRYRKRYLDLISNPQAKAIFKKRSLIIRSIREFFEDKGFFELETPILQTLAGGAIAKPFKTHHNALDIELFLRVAPELYLKRLIIGGYEKVYEIARCFRNEGIDHSHNPEFTQIEFYWAYADYKDLMKLMEEFFEFLLLKLHKDLIVEYEGEKIDFKPPWPVKTFRQIVQEYANFDIEDYPDQASIYKKAKEINVNVEKTDGRGKIIDEIYKEHARPKIINPIFLIEHPIELSPLAKQKVSDPRYVERFQLVCAKGFELCNSFSELNDPIDQEERFKAQEKLLKAGDDEAMTSDDDFVEALKHGMPPTAGLGMGIDRLTALLTDSHALKEVIAFPTMKPKLGNDNQESDDTVQVIDPNTKVSLSKEAVVLGLKTSYAIIKGVEIKKSNPESEKEKEEIAKIKIDLDDLRLSSMRKAYKSFGVDPRSKAPSSEALIKRINNDKPVYTVNTLVDSYNVSSIRERLPMAAYDLTKVQFPIILREAKEGETIAIIGGEKKIIKKGEIVYSDAQGVVCMDFNYRDSDRTKITDKTKDIIVFVDATSDVSDEDLEISLQNTIDLIIKHNGGEVVEQKIISKMNSSLQISSEKSTQDLGINYQQAQGLLSKYITNDITKLHCRESEVIMRALAKHLSEDEEKWGIVGLLHDIDWDLTKEDVSNHSVKAMEILQEAGASEFLIETIVSHVYGTDCGDYEGKERTTKLQHLLASAETVTGLIVASTLVRPDKQIANLELKSLKKKYKNKSFAANCNREVIAECEDAGVGLDEFLEIGLKALQGISDEMGL